MKITMFEQAPYRFLPDDFEHRYEAVCSTPYSLADRDGVYASIRDFVDELMAGARAGLDGVSLTEHGQSSYDMVPNPNLVASALAYATEVEQLPVAICPMGRSLGKSREPIRVAEEYAMIDVMSGGRLVAGFPIGLNYDAAVNNGVPPMQIRSRFEENFDLVRRAWTEREPFVHNGRHSQYPQVNLWPRPLQPCPPTWIIGVGNPRTMRSALENDLGFNYFGFVGAKLTGRRVFGRFWELADQLGIPRNPFRVGMVQTIAVADTDAEAEKRYGRHVEYAFRKGLGSIPMERLAMPGGIDIRGVNALLRDAGDFGFYGQMKTGSYRELVEAGVVVAGGVATVRDQLVEYFREHGVGNLHAMLGFGSLPRELALENVRLFASEVAPRLREIWKDSGFEHHWWPERLGGTPRTAAPAGDAGPMVATAPVKKEVSVA
jgi:alkanesulfonate monooxygenase SsuD/methylene tetrahydromethanopterin reductase-like flavin-dependent oxidoreductase (luciferase family)